MSGERPRGEATRDAGPDPDEPPPIAGRWSRLYALVVLELAACIALGLWLTHAFR